MENFGAMTGPSDVPPTPDSRANLSGAALQSLREGLIAVDGRGTIRLYNAAAAELLGVPIDDAIGKAFAAVFLELPHADALTDCILKAIQTGALETDHEIEVEGLAGRRQLQVTTAFLRDESIDASSQGVVITLHDVSELRHLSGALEETNKQLQSAVRDAEEKNQRLTEALKRVQVMRIGATVIVLALVGGLTWYSLRMESPTATGSPTPDLASGHTPASAERQVTAETGTISRSIRLSGSLDPRGRITVVAPVGGRVVQRPFRVGEMVTQGQLLMEIRDDTLPNRIRTAEVNASRAATRVEELRNWESGTEVQESRRSLTLAQMSVNEQRKTLDEAERLFARDIIPEQELTTAKAALQRAEISAQSAQQNFDQVMKRASKAVIAEAQAEQQNADDELTRLRAEIQRQQVVAPVSGLVVNPPASGRSEGGGTVPSPGDTVSAGGPLLAIGDVGSFAVTLKVDELEVKRIHTGQPATVTIDALEGTPLTGEVAAVAGQAVTENGAPTFEVRVAIKDVPDAVRKTALLGMTATVEVVTALRENVVVVPIEAVTHAGEPFVMVVEKPGAAPVKRAVTTGLADHSRVEIASGLKKGEVVVY
jgi:PAS domain S-box-containing protein